MRVLLTSPRAPVTIDLARRFSARGDQVFVADSVRFPAGAFSRSTQMRHVPRPREGAHKYVAKLNKIVIKEKIDLLVPTCEEVFFIAAYRNLISCQVLVDSLETLAAIHDKWSFSKIGSNEFGRVPESSEITSSETLRQFASDSSDYVFKPSFSRFASETLISPTPSTLAQVTPTDSKRWIAQRRVLGTEYSTYSIAHQGRLVAHACYRSAYRMGGGHSKKSDRPQHGSGIYFVGIDIPLIEKYVETFVVATGYTGQIGFDCIVDKESQLWILEGNPRSTSGVHLFDESQLLCDALDGSVDTLLKANSARSPMVGFAMPIWGFADALRQRKFVSFIQDWWHGRDVLLRWTDPLPALMLPVMLGELAWLAIRERKSLQQASTFDIEWNGETL